ncbi:hypothetical protein E8D34_02995 [Nocardioides sp. GY 10113]|uniref:hypothetical protein n=1 Tax=Nocardioides sp. GY 10113 TaxID=2569761 RepID=UPI0010A78B4D|nr:hypothetical protein [Nocardioides sp. GY 10113]TIC88657.1 hypothetical protein E8D34_02995 [Nocardioides sp. GY 10113]
MTSAGPTTAEGHRAWRTVDLGTRKFWRAAGRRVDLDGAESWLRGPTSGRGPVTDDWLEAEAARLGGSVVRGRAGSGLLRDLAELDGPGFSAALVHPRIRDFYERTSGWRMEVWVGWSPVFWPGGELISRLFGRRLDQLALPTRSLDVARGMDSEVSLIVDDEGVQRAAAWTRTVRSTGDRAFSGSYSTRLLPGARRRSVHAAFPLESGNVQVFLRPEHGPNGSFFLRSPGGRFGQDGAYVVADDRGATYAASAPIRESFHLYLDDEGVLRADHQLRLWSATAVRLHYRLDPVR